MRRAAASFSRSSRDLRRNPGAILLYADGGCWHHRHGVENEGRAYRRQVCCAYRCLDDYHRAQHGRHLGQTHLGRVVGMGCTFNLDVNFIVFIFRNYRAVLCIF